MEVRHQKLQRYILPLREGGSLPALAEADDGFRYAVKLKGAGHGTKSLVAEFLGGMIAKAFKLKVPELVFLDLSELFGITEPDFEVQQLLRKSEGLNVGLHFLDKAMTFEPSVNPVSSSEASRIVWFDAFIENIDRSRQNPNMMIWNNELWLIDHGSAFYYHHSGKDPLTAAGDPFPYIRNHVLLSHADRLVEADSLMKQAITPRTIAKIVGLLPDDWLVDDLRPEASPQQLRQEYTEFLTRRLADSSVFVNKAIEERNRLLNV